MAKIVKTNPKIVVEEEKGNLQTFVVSGSVKKKIADTKQDISDSNLSKINSLLNLAVAYIELGESTKALLYINKVENFLDISLSANASYNSIKEIYAFLDSNGYLKLETIN